MPGPQRDLLLPERILQDLDTRTSQERPGRAFIEASLIHGICKIFMQGPLREDLSRICTRSSHKDLTRSCKDLWQDSRSPQGLGEDLHHGPPRQHHETLASS
jgi:hypothetical protein